MYGLWFSWSEITNKLLEQMPANCLVFDTITFRQIDLDQAKFIVMAQEFMNFSFVWKSSPNILNDEDANILSW